MIQTEKCDSEKCREIELRLRRMVRWLEANQPDVFKRGLWDALLDNPTQK